jgi:hypothetical protein
MLNMKTNNRTHEPDSRGNDSYNTHPVAVRALLAVEPDVPDILWEASAGAGFIVEALKAAGKTVIATDLTRRKRGFPCVGGVDFLQQTEMPRRADHEHDYQAQGIFTNPPFKIADKYVAKCLELAPRAYLQLRVGYLAGLRWTDKRYFRAHCTRVHIFSPRLPMMHRKNYKGPKNENSALDLAWYVFERDGNSGMVNPGPRSNWLDWRDYATAEELADVKRRRREAAAAAKLLRIERDLGMGGKKLELADGYA